jgi:hypothetical protein
MENKTYYLRFSDYIQEDLKRGWSSWNYGADGVWMTEEELEALYESSLSIINRDDSEMEEIALSISEFHLTHKSFVETYKRGLIRPLYWEGQRGYFVVVDENYSNSLAVVELEVTSLQEAIEIVEKESSNLLFSCSETQLPADAKLVWSKDGCHIFVEEED